MSAREAGGDPCVGFPGDPDLQPATSPDPDPCDEPTAETKQNNSDHYDPYLDPSLPCLDPARPPSTAESSEGRSILRSERKRGVGELKPVAQIRFCSFQTEPKRSKNIPI